MKKTVYYIHIISFLIGILLPVSSKNADSLYQNALHLIYQQPDSARLLLEECLPFFEDEDDTSKVIQTKRRLVNLYSGSGNYQKAYDEAWSLLRLVEESQHKEALIEVHQQLGSLYIIFDQFDKAHQHLEKSISLAHNLKPETTRSTKLSTLYAIKAWLITNESADFIASEKLLYLALKENLKAGHLNDVYIQMQLAELYILNDSIAKAEHILSKLEQQYKNQTITSNSLMFDHLGQLQMKKEDYQQAIAYFKRCIQSIDAFQNHLDNKVKVLDSLASCYSYLGLHDSAFHYSRLSINEERRLFGSKSTMNKALFEVKNTYEEQLQKQRLELLDQEKKVLQMKTFIYVTILLLVILAIIIISRRRNLRLQQLNKRQHQEKIEQEAHLENKNRELTASALKLIEREALLEDIRKNLDSMAFKKVNQKAIKSLISSINANKAKNWNEFELYFTSVNKDFFDVLKQRFPLLSNTDLKMCALLKLGMSSKDMASIMAIGIDSINTSRSRIRKKMQLKREVNLTGYLQDLSQN